MTRRLRDAKGKDKTDKILEATLKTQDTWNKTSHASDKSKTD